MDPRLLQYYNRELQFMREMGAEYAREFPKIAGRLGLEGFECADPYVERLLEGFSFLAARIQLKLDAQYPRFAQHLLEMVHPNYLSPVPSVAIVQFTPDSDGGTPPEGLDVPRGTILRSRIGKGEQTACEYRTAHHLTLWPYAVAHVDYLPNTGALEALKLPPVARSKAGLRIQLKTVGGVPFSALTLDSVVLHVQGADELPAKIFEQVVAATVSVVARPGGKATDEILPRTAVRPIGLRDEDALLPTTRWGFQGYRLLQEYFACPQRVLFFEISGLRAAISRCEGEQFEIFILFDRREGSLERVVHADHLAPFCAPAINLFPRKADRIRVEPKAVESHVVPDRTRPRDFEVYTVSRAVGYGANSDSLIEFSPFYALTDRARRRGRSAYFSLRREPRRLGEKEQRAGTRSSYIGTEVFISLVDAGGGSFGGELRHLALDTLCTNRDLPLHMALGQGPTDFTLQAGLPVESVRSLGLPTSPWGNIVEGEFAWRLISQLSLNYLSLLDDDPAAAGSAIRELLHLYADSSDRRVRGQVEGVRSLVGTRVVDRLPGGGPIAFGRGMEIQLTCDESAFQGMGVFPLALVLEEFFARYVSINSFTRTTLHTVERGEIMTWPPRIGQRALI